MKIEPHTYTELLLANWCTD